MYQNRTFVPEENTSNSDIHEFVETISFDADTLHGVRESSITTISIIMKSSVFPSVKNNNCQIP